MERIVRRGDMAANIKQFNMAANKKHQDDIKYNLATKKVVEGWTMK